MERWANKVAVVTGAGSGIGAQICLDLCSNHLRVFGLDFNQDHLAEIKERMQQTHPEAQFTVIHCDLTKEDQIEAAFEKIVTVEGGVDVLVNNAGVLGKQSILSAPMVDISQMMQTNVVAMISCAQKAIKSMRDRDVEGHIVNLCSVAGHTQAKVPGEPVLSAYVASKHAVRVLNQMLNQELAHFEVKKIRLSNISPGAVGGTKISVAGSTFDNLLQTEGSLTPKEVSSQIIHILSLPSHLIIREMILESAGFAFY